MAHTALTPVFVGLRTGLHLLFGVLTVLVIGRAILVPTRASVALVALSCMLLATYATGGIFARASRTRGRVPGLVWLALVTAEWVLLLWLNSVAAYLVFPLFFLYLHLLGRRIGTVMVIATTVVAILVLGAEGGWTVGGVIGPVVGAAVAVMIGLGYQALAREAHERELLMAELIATRDQLVATEHESGVLAERARLACEIHDTVAQGLSSIQMLLHAAERADTDRPGLEHIRLARETAASSLADTRRFIRELTPPNLDEVGLGGTLRRLAETQWAGHGLVVNVRISDSLSLPMQLQTALLRIAQGAMANVIQHAEARTATITLAVDSEALTFTVADDGRGFDSAEPSASHSARKTDSFGLQATQERVDQLGGILTVESAPGKGTIVTVNLALQESS
ncbi:sensor histidine kinase [Lacisediminihabitans sp. FW035]